MSAETSTVVAQFRNDAGLHVAVVKTGYWYRATCEACGPVASETTAAYVADGHALRHSKTCAKLPRRLWVEIDWTVAP